MNAVGSSLCGGFADIYDYKGMGQLSIPLKEWQVIKKACAVGEMNTNTGRVNNNTQECVSPPYMK